MLVDALAMPPDARPDDPYRVLFEHLASGAARCRLVAERDQVVAVEILDSNPAFAAVRGILPSLLAAFTQIRATGRPETVQVRLDAAVLSASLYPAGPDEAMCLVEDLTLHTELERQSQLSQERFEKAFQGNGAAMVIADQADLRIIDVNPRWLELFGATREEVIGRTSVELGLISPQVATARIAHHKQFAASLDVELALITRAGVPFTVLASAKRIVIGEGTFTLTTLIDITRRKQAEEAFAATFNASPAGMMLVDAATDLVISTNARMLELTGFARSDLVGHAAHTLGIIRTPRREELLAEVARAGRLDGVEVELACKDGTGVWTLASTELITLDGRPHRLSVFTDIAARKRFEDRLLTQYAVGRGLAESSDLETAVPHVLEALCRGDGWDCGAVWLPGDSGALECRGIWHDRNDAPELAAVTRATVVAFNAGVLGRVLASGAAEKIGLDPARGPHGAAAFSAGMRGAVAFPILRGAQTLGVVAMATRRADPAPLDSAALGLFDSVGRLLGLFVERTRAEASLRELNSELERRVHERTLDLETSNAELQSFTSSVSHDLRAPLRAILGFSAILVEDFGDQLPDEAKELLASIHAGGTRLRSLIDDLLAFSRLGRQSLHRTDVDTDALVASVVAELVPGRDLGDRLALTVRPLGVSRADPTLLRAVWTNLIDNALKYARTQPKIVIEIGCEVRAEERVYYVRDNGVGFDMAYVDRLFTVFQRLHSAAEFEGSGVGLANVRRIVERHQGRVAVTSEVGRGSRFEFTLGP